jgi:hypothetical protein
MSSLILGRKLKKFEILAAMERTNNVFWSWLSGSLQDDKD